MHIPFSIEDVHHALTNVPHNERLNWLKQKLEEIPDIEERNKFQVELLMSFALGLPTPTPKVVVLIHGIRTRAVWQDVVAHELRKHPNVHVYLIKYGRLDLFRFWFPFFFRGKPVARVLRELRGIRALHKSADISVLAHSFGTYIITKILKTQPDVELRHLLLCGSVVDNAFAWDALAKFPSGGVLNDVGTKDMLPALAKMSSWGYGATGTFGFGTHKVVDRYHSLGHSGFFEPEHINTYWIPYFLTDAVVESEWSHQRPSPSGWLSFAESVPIKTLLLVICISASFMLLG